MKAICTVVWDNDQEREAYLALVRLSRNMDAQEFEETHVVELIQMEYPEVWTLFQQDRMCGECTGAGSDLYGYPCKVCRATGIVPITVER